MDSTQDENISAPEGQENEDGQNETTSTPEGTAGESAGADASETTGEEEAGKQEA